MSDKVEYEPVPESDLNEYQRFHINKAKTQDVEPYQGGIAAEVLGIPAIAGAKTLKGVLGSNITKEITNRIAEKIAPSDRTVLERQIQGTIDPETGATGRARQTGYNATTMEQAAERAQNALRLQSLDEAKLTSPFDPVRGGAGFNASTPSGIHTTPQSLQGLNLNPGTAQALEELKPLNAYQRAMQTVQNIPGTAMASKIVNNPIVKGAGTVGGLWEGGENLVRLWNHFKHDKPAREMLDVAGVLSNAAMLAPTPASPWSNIAGAVTSLPIGMYQRHLEEQDAAQKKATGGLVCLENGGQPDPLPIQKNNPMVEQEAQKALTEIAKRKALYELGQIAEQERARQAASRMKTSSVSPSILPANLEPSGSGGPTLLNPLNR
jgi:hypothetical protein